MRGLDWLPGHCSCRKVEPCIPGLLVAFAATSIGTRHPRGYSLFDCSLVVISVFLCHLYFRSSKVKSFVVLIHIRLCSLKRTRAACPPIIAELATELERNKEDLPRKYRISFHSMIFKQQTAPSARFKSVVLIYQNDGKM